MNPNSPILPVAALLVGARSSVAGLSSGESMVADVGRLFPKAAWTVTRQAISDLRYPNPTKNKSKDSLGPSKKHIAWTDYCGVSACSLRFGPAGAIPALGTLSTAMASLLPSMPPGRWRHTGTSRFDSCRWITQQQPRQLSARVGGWRGI